MAIAPIPMPRSARPGGYPSNPFQQFFGTKQGANTLMGIGAGLLSGDWSSIGPYAMQGSQLDNAYMEQQKAEAEEAQARNETVAWMERMGETDPRYAQLVEAVRTKGLPVADAWKTAMDWQAGGADAPSNVREWEYYNALAPEQKGEYLRMKRANPYLDIGTGFVQPDPVNPGTLAGPVIAKDNYTPAYDAAAGGAEAKVDVENQSAYDSLASKLPGLQAVIGELGELANKATYTVTGQLIDSAMREAGLEPSDAAVARSKYVAMVDNQILPLLRDTFGAQFTAKEGETLRATLGDPNKSPAEKQVILEAFIEQKVRDLEALGSRLPGGGAAGGDVDAILKKHGVIP